MSEASPEAWLSERSGAAPPSDSSLRRMLRLQGQEATAESAAEEASGSGTRGSGGMASGGSGGMASAGSGGMARGAAPPPGQQARPRGGEAAELGRVPRRVAQCQGGVLVPRRVARGALSLLAHPPPLEIGSCERLSERLRPPGSLTSSSEGLCPAAAGCGAGLLPEERIWWSTCMAPASEPGVRLSCRLIVCSLAAGVSPKA